MNSSYRNNKKIRKSLFAGKFYPGTKAALENELTRLFSKAKGKLAGNLPLRAIISPHAGYVYSGQVAASAYHQIPEDQQFKKVFILASSHQFNFSGAAVFDAESYSTPLGEVKVDKALTRKLIKSCNLFIKYPEAHDYEHSLEVQLPFLQYIMHHDFLLVPIILGTSDPSECKEIARHLDPYFTPENLFIISTDFSHYPEYDDAIKIDLLTAEAICNNNPGKLLEEVHRVKKKSINQLVTSLCGWTSVLTLLYLTQNKNLEYKKVEYRNSGDADYYGDKEKVVGYWALAVFEKEVSFQLSEEEQQELLGKARKTIENFVNREERDDTEPPLTNGILQQKLGAFVSIYVQDELRGCIGCFAMDKTLNDLVQHMAISSACDSRFSHLESEELNQLEIEISVLTPLKKIKSIDEIKPGIHGIYIKKGAHSGTFLPQVATKTGWNTEQLLGHCSRDKAGIGWDGWKDAEISVYEAFIFRG
ncbi:MAG: AmmeMemoRadiSam system protein B [Mariniphaga sp.]